MPVPAVQVADAASHSAGGIVSPHERPAVVRQILTGSVLEHLEAIRREQPFVGSPLSEAHLQETADAAARMFRVVQLHDRIAAGTATQNELFSVLMAVWAGGFKAGADYVS